MTDPERPPAHHLEGSRLITPQLYQLAASASRERLSGGQFHRLQVRAPSSSQGINNRNPKNPRHTHGIAKTCQNFVAFVSLF